MANPTQGMKTRLRCGDGPFGKLSACLVVALRTCWPVVLFQISRAKRIARPTSVILAWGKDVIRVPILPFETVCRWSQLIAQSRGMPSAFERKTSDGMSRTVLVMGATVMSPRYSNTESLVSMRTGLCLSG